jgi:hypothetical protein
MVDTLVRLISARGSDRERWAEFWRAMVRHGLIEPHARRKRLPEGTAKV